MLFGASSASAVPRQQSHTVYSASRSSLFASVHDVGLVSRAFFCIRRVTERIDRGMSYKAKKFRDRWGERFKIVELDDYAEELLEMDEVAV